MNTTAWMREVQRKYKAAIRPEQLSKRTWEGWCHFAALRSYEQKPLTLEQRWKQRCASAASANRHRTPNVRTRKAIKKQSTWEQACKKMEREINAVSRGKTLEQRWRAKLNSKASNHKRRMKRKAEMKRSREKHSS